MDADELKGAIAPHSTAISKGAWDGAKAAANLKADADAAYYRKAFAWVDSKGDPKTKGAYKFIHHEMGADGAVGAANMTACSAAMAVLNGGRGGAAIPEGDRKAVWAHLAAHLRDGKLFPPPLKMEDAVRTEVKTLARRFELKAVDEATRTFEGVVAAFSLDFGGDVIEKGAFKRTLRDWNRGKGRIVPLIDSHGRDSIRRVVGKLLEAEEQDVGLWTKHDIIEGPDGDEIYRRVKGGYVDGMSIGYKAVQVRSPSEEESRRGIWRFLKEIKLTENSLVVEPMNPDARVDLSTVKSADRDDVRRVLMEQYTADEIEALKAGDGNIRALLEELPPEEELIASDAAAKALAPNNPRRAVMEERLRSLTLRGLGIGA